MKEEKVEFVPKNCPKCGEPLVVRKLGVWGYYCLKDSFWWGVMQGHPKTR